MRPWPQVVEGERHVRRDTRTEELLDAATEAGRPMPAYVARDPYVELQSIVPGASSPCPLNSEGKSLLQLTKKILKGEPEATRGTFPEG